MQLIRANYFDVGENVIIYLARNEKELLERFDVLKRDLCVRHCEGLVKKTKVEKITNM